MPVQREHKHDVIGCAMVRIQTIRTEPLRMLDDEGCEAEIDETSSEDEASDDDLFSEKGTRGKYIVTKVCRLHVELVTNHGHGHPVIDETATIPHSINTSPTNLRTHQGVPQAISNYLYAGTGVASSPAKCTCSKGTI